MLKQQGMCAILFQPSGRHGSVACGTSIKEAARGLGVDIAGLCAETATCGKCKVRLHPSPAAAAPLLSPVSETEKSFLSLEELTMGMRLACQAHVQGDIVVSVPEGSHVEAPIIRKEAQKVAFELSPAVRHYTVKLESPTLGDSTADWERLQNALETQSGLKNLTIDLPTLQSLPKAIRHAEFKPHVFIWQEKEVIALSHNGSYYGVAIDIGTTTMAAYLCDLSSGELLASASGLNPQASYGEDVMSRITYAMTHDDGLNTLHQTVVNGVNDLIHNCCTQAGIESQDILDMVAVGNTCMHHLFLNISPAELGKAPFVPAVQHSLDVKARELGIHINPGAYIYTLPVEGGFVGADNVGVLIAEAPYKQDRIELIADIGTNGELLLGNRDRLLCCSCATGPALEGAHIKFGMRAAPGAIERIRVDHVTAEVTFKIIGADKWQNHAARGICGSAIIDILPQLLLAGVLDKSGRFNSGATTPRLRTGNNGMEFVLAWANETAINPDIVITQDDVRAIQLAKAAMYAGAKIMMRRLGVEKVERVILAGAFGSYIDKESAALLGLFPDCALENIRAVGNAAGDGARLALLDIDKRHEAEDMAHHVEYVELTLEPDFDRIFAEAMWIPHMKDVFPHLEALTENKEAGCK